MSFSSFHSSEVDVTQSMSDIELENPNSLNGAERADHDNEMEVDNNNNNNSSIVQEADNETPIVSSDSIATESRDTNISQNNRLDKDINRYRKSQETKDMQRKINQLMIDNEALKTAIKRQTKTMDRNKNESKQNSKKIDDWKGILIEPYSTDMALHCQTIERKLEENGFVSNDRKASYLLSSLVTTLKVNIEGSYSGNIHSIDYEWVKNELVTKYSKKGIITDNTESYAEKLAGITMRSNETTMDILARINIQRNLFRKSTDGDNLLMLEKVDEAALTILKSRSGDKIQKAVNIIRRKWITGEVRPSNPESEWISLYNHFLINDPLEGQTLMGGIPKKSFERKEKDKKIFECRYGENCKRKETCRFSHNNKAEKGIKRNREEKSPFPEKSTKKPRVMVDICKKCEHKHPVDVGCDKCYTCKPELRPSRR